MNELPKDMLALAMCVSLLDELWESDNENGWIQVSKIVHILRDRYATKAHLIKQDVEASQKVTEGFLSAMEKVYEASILECVKQNENGGYYIDDDMFRQKHLDRLEEERIKRRRRPSKALAVTSEEEKQ